MDIKNFVLSYYKNSAEDFHIHKVENAVEAKKPHTHDYFQVYYISNGSLLHHLKGSTTRLYRGDMLIVPPETIHSITPDIDAVFYSFSFMPGFFGEQTKSNRYVVNFLRSIQKEGDVRPKVSINSEDIFYVESIMEHILKEFNEKSTGYDECIRAYSIILITMIMRSYLSETNSSLPDFFENNKLYVIHCIDYIKNNFTENITLEEISKRSTMSKSSFCSLFLELTGHTFNGYLNLCRIKKSAEYILEGYKITAVYGLCGYNDFSTFYRNFKKIMGISPNEYRLKLKAAK